MLRPSQRTFQGWLEVASRAYRVVSPLVSRKMLASRSDGVESTGPLLTVHASKSHVWTTLVADGCSGVGVGVGVGG